MKYSLNGTRLECKYSPDQARDERGRFGEGGSAIAASAARGSSLVGPSGNPNTDQLTRNAMQASHLASQMSAAVKAGEAHKGVAIRQHDIARSLHRLASDAHASIGSMGSREHTQIADMHAQAARDHSKGNH